MKIHAQKNHPRYLSNYYRDLLVWGVKKNITSLQGLTAHGRGEAFDYLLGEKTQDFAEKAISAAVALLLRAKYPIISVNGNSAILSAGELVILSEKLHAPLEINLFHASKVREKNIKKYLQKFGANTILIPDNTALKNVSSSRRMISSLGQKKSDLILLPLEDGDRTQALKKIGKKVITIDLNPLSRTAQTADIAIIDNLVRVIPLMTKQIEKFKNCPQNKLTEIIESYDNRKIICEALGFIQKRLLVLAR